MAFVGGTSQQEEDPNKQGQPGAQNPLAQQAPVTTSSAPGAGPGAAPASSATGAVASNQATPQPFTNLQAYLTANQPQIQGMGEKIAGQIGQQYGQVQNDINAGTTGFKNAVTSGYAAPNQDLVTQATTNPTDFAKDPTNVQAFQKQLNNAYTGPSNFEGSDYYANLNKEVQSAATKANQVNTPSGLQSYLTGIETNPTAGDTTLDQVLLYGNPGALNTIKGAASQATGLPDYLSSLIPGQNQSVSDAQTAANTSRDAARTGLTTAGTNFASDLQKRLDEAQGNYTTYNQDVGQIRGAAQDINSQIQAYLAANPQLSLDRSSNYLAPWLNLSEATNAPTLGNVAGTNDYATQAALAQLSGDSGLFNSPINQSTASQAGSFNLPLDLQGAISNQDIPAAMTKEVQSLSNQIQGAYTPLQNAEEMANAKGTLPNELSAAQKTYDQALKGGTMADGTIAPAWQPQIDAAKASLDAVQGKISQAEQKFGPMDSWQGWDTVAPMAQGLQWLTPASTGYNDLVSKLQADLQGLSKMNVPQSKAPALPGKTPEQLAGNSASTAVGVGAPVAAGLGGASAAANAIEAANVAAGGFGEGLATSGAPGAYEAANLGADASAGLQALGPAALAAYGTSNIAQNVAANPVQNSLATLANTGLSLATLSLPPKILDQLGSKLKGVIDSIGNFFGGLF